MLRKLSYIILISCTLSLNSCRLGDDEKDKIAIGFSQSINNDIWRKSMDHAMEVEASLHPEVSLTIYNANRKAKNQIRDIQKFIDAKMDVIIVSPFESDSIVPVIEKARAKGIPVIIVDRKANTSEYTAFLGADNLEVGRLAGKHIASKSNGSANVIEINADLNTSPGLERSLGFKQILKWLQSIQIILDILKEII